MALLQWLPGRLNFTGLEHYGGRPARTPARWFARPFPLARLAVAALGALLILNISFVSLSGPGLRSLIRVQAERTGPRGRRQRSVRYYISSRPAQAQALLDLARGHWGVENGLHRTLDVQFREDDCRIRRGHGPAVMGILRRAALNMVRTVQQNLSSYVSIGLLRDRIGRQPWLLAPSLP